MRLNVAILGRFKIDFFVKSTCWAGLGFLLGPMACVYSNSLEKKLITDMGVKFDGF